VSVECLRTEAARAAAVIAEGIDEDGGSQAPPDGCSSDSVVESSSSEDDLFKVGDQRWPVRADIVAQFLQTDGIGAGISGVAGKAHRLRQLAAKKLIVKDVGDIPEDRVFSHQQCCGEAHPGLCAHRDRKIYDDALLLAKNFERCLHKGLHTVCLIIEDQDIYDEGPPKEPMFIFFARVRPRRLHMQATHVVLECLPHSDGTLSCKQRAPRQWDFMTLWSLARRLLRARWENIQLITMNCSTPDDENALLGSFCPVDQVRAADNHWQLWPGTYHRPRPPPRDNNGPDLGDRPVRRPRRPTGGVKASLPRAALPPRRAPVVGGGHGNDADGGVYFDLSDDDDIDGGGGGSGDDSIGPDDAAPQREVVHEHQWN
jgi:hypothetical protein